MPTKKTTIAEAFSAAFTVGYQFVPAEVRPMNVVVVGNTGSGKSATARGSFVEPLLIALRRTVIIDPTGVWWGLRFMADGSPGFSIAIVGGLYGDVALRDTDGEHIAKWIAEHDQPVIIDLSEMSMGEKHRFATDFFAALYRYNRRPLHLIIDEADEFCPQNPLPETRLMLHHVDRLVRRGRVKGFRVLLVTQRPAVLHKNVLSQASAMVAMRLLGSQDRDAVQTWIKGNASLATGKEVLNTLAGMQVGEGWLWAPSHGILNRGKFPLFTTFDSSRTPGDDEPPVEPPGPFPYGRDFLPLHIYMTDNNDPDANDEATEEKPSIGQRKQPSLEITGLNPEGFKQAIESAKAEGYELGHADGVAKGYDAATSTLQGKLTGVMKAADEFMQQLRTIAGQLDITSAIRSLGDEAPRTEVIPVVIKNKAFTDYHDDLLSKIKSSITSNVKGKGLTPAGERIKSQITNDAAASKMLPAIASFPHRGVSWSEIGVLALMSSESGYFRKGRRYLIDNGLVLEAGGLVGLSSEGLKLFPSVEPIKFKELIRNWIEKVDKPADQILAALINPRATKTKNELADELGKSCESGYWRKGMRALMRLNLIELNNNEYSLSTFLRELAKVSP